jgi:GT2 family glycosyltransferase
VLSEAPKSLFISIVTFNSEDVIVDCLNALNLHNGQRSWQVYVIDNASTDKTQDIIKAYISKYSLQSTITLILNQDNVGFCGGHNQALFIFLKSNINFILLLNPDLQVNIEAVEDLLADAEQRRKKDSRATAFTGKVLRSPEDENNPIIDTTGVYFNKSLRHLDRGAGDLDKGQFNEPQQIEGISGAFLLMHKDFIIPMIVPQLSKEREIEKIYPQLGQKREKRVNFFDEAFFAYREDAEIALRAKNFDLHMWYVPFMVGYHKRHVTPEKRQSLPAIINLLGVRNRFLLQILHFSPLDNLGSILPGLIVRNMLVICSVILYEHSSLSAFKHLQILFKRAWERRIYFENVK